MQARSTIASVGCTTMKNDGSQIMNCCCLLRRKAKKKNIFSKMSRNEECVLEKSTH